MVLLTQMKPAKEKEPKRTESDLIYVVREVSQKGRGCDPHSPSSCPLTGTTYHRHRRHFRLDATVHHLGLICLIFL